MGTTYFFMRIGVETFPPFLFSALRQVIAGSVILTYLKLLGKLRLSKNTLLTQTILGILLISLGSGVIGWTERFIPSGLAALIVATLPMYVIFINYVAGLENRKPNSYILIGLLLGSLGIFLIFRDNLMDFINPDYLVGTLIAFGASFCWAAGSVFSKSQCPQKDVMTNAALQMLLGGVVLFIMSYFFDDYTEITAVTPQSLYALGYLTLIGSGIAYPCYIYALDKLPIGIVSLYAYINPFIALILGYFILNERITWITTGAFMTVLLAIYCINKGYKMKVDKINIRAIKNK